MPGKPAPARQLPIKITKAATQNHHEMAERQGEGLVAAFSKMANSMPQRSEEKTAIKYLIGYAIEKPEAL